MRRFVFIYEGEDEVFKPLNKVKHKFEPEILKDDKKKEHIRTSYDELQCGLTCLVLEEHKDGNKMVRVSLEIEKYGILTILKSKKQFYSFLI